MSLSLYKTCTRSLFSLGVAFIILAVVPTQAQATIKTQQGTVTITAGNASTTQSITAVNDLSRAFLIMWSTGDSGALDPGNHEATGYLSATNQITFERAGTADDCQIGYFVIEADSEEFSVTDRGSLTIAAAATTQDTAVTAITQTRSFIAANSRIGAAGGGATNNHKGYATVHFLTDSSIRAQRDASGTYSCIVRYEVVQWHADAGVSIQSKEFSGSIGTAEVTSTIDTGVTTGQTWLYATMGHSSAQLSQTAVDMYLKNSTTVGFIRYSGTYTSRIRWWAIQFPADVVVQRVTSQQTANKNDYTMAVTFSPVTIANSWADAYASLNATGTAIPRQRWYTQISGTTTVTHTRFYNGQLSRVSTQLINANAWNFIADSTPPNNPTLPADGWNTAAKINVLPNNTWQNDYNTAYIEWSGATDPGGSGVSGYSIYQGTASDGEPGLTQEQTAEFFDAGTAPSDGIYYIRLRTFDNAGNYSAAETAFVFKADTTVPSANPTSPSGAWQTSSKITAITDGTWQADDDTPYFEWTGAADAASGVNGYSVYWGTSSSGEPGTTEEQTAANYEVLSASGEGTNYLRVRTFDTAGNYTSPVTLFTLQYDTSAPANPTAPAGAWESSSKITPITNNISQNDDDTPYFEWSGASDSVSAVAGYSIYWGTSAIGEPGTTQEQAGATYDVATPTGNATNYLRVRTFDSAGNYSAPITLFTFIYDNQKPTVTINVSPNPTGAVAIGALEFELVFSESMNTGVAPTVTYDPAGATGVQTVSTSSAWSTTTYTNDTYTVYNDAAITSSTGDGAAATSVTVAEDAAGNAMDPDTNDTFTVDSAMHHFRVEHDGAGLINVAEAITITAVTQGGNTVTDYTGSITVSVLGETGQITWADNTVTNSVTDGGVDDDSATYTFHANDNGSIILDMTSTAPDTLDIEVTDSTYNDDDTEGVIVVSSYALDHFVISHDNAGIAGIGENVKVTAINTEAETKTDYVGTITLNTSNGTAAAITWQDTAGNQGNFSSGGAGSGSATYTFNINDNGVANFTFRDTKVENVDIDCNDGLKTDLDGEGTMNIIPGAIEDFVVGHDNAAIAGTPENVTVTARDAYGNTKTDYTGTVTLDTNTSDINAISWAKPGGQTGFSDGGAGSDNATYTFQGADNGSVLFTVTDTKTESIDIDVTAGANTDDDTEGVLVVSPAAIGSFSIGHDNAAAAGVAENVTVTAKDTQGNIKTDYAGQITLNSQTSVPSGVTWASDIGNGGGFSDLANGTATYTFVGGDSGSALFTITDITQESIDIDITGDATDNDSEGNLVVGAPVIWSFVIVHDGAGNAGVAESVTVTAKDSLNNTMTGYTGQIQLDTDSSTPAGIAWQADVGNNGSFNDGGAGVDTALYTYNVADNGVATFYITDNTVESIDIDVTGDQKTDTESEGNLVVGNPILGHFAVSHDNAATAGSNENITVTAIDSIGNTLTSFAALVTVSAVNGTGTAIDWSTAASGSFADNNDGTCTYTFVGGDNGSVVFVFNDIVVETVDIDVSGDGKTDDDNEGNLVVSPGSLDHFVIDHNGSALISIPESITITAKDANENTIPDYTGTIDLDTTGTATTIAWALQSGAGTLNDDGPSFDTADYTYHANDNGVVVLTITNSATESVNISVTAGAITDDDLEGFLDFSSASDIIVDNTDSGYSDGGNSWSNRTGGTYYGTNWRRDTTGQDGGWAQWQPTVTIGGNYEVYFMSRSPITGYSTQAPVTVYYDGGSQLYPVDLTTYGNPNWLLLGAHNFATGTSGYVRMTDDIESSALDISADVVKWVLKGIGNATANAVTTSTIGVGSTNNLILDFTVTNQHSVLDTVTSITVDNIGTATDAEISSVKLYYDSNNSGDFSVAGDTQVGNGTFSSGTKVFSGLSVNINASGGTEDFFVIVDISTSAADGKTVDVRVPSRSIVLNNAGKIPVTTVNSSGTRELDITLNRFVITHDNAGVAGTNENITIVAKDSFGNTKTDYTGTITVDATGGTGTAITWGTSAGGGFIDYGDGTADYTFILGDSGQVILTLNDTKAETINIDITGDATDENAEGDLIVAPAPIDHFVIAHDGNGVANVAETVTVTAKDAFENTIKEYQSQVTLSTDGTDSTIGWTLSSGYGVFDGSGAGVGNAYYTFHDSDDGVATFTLTDDTAETFNITVSGSGKLDDNTEGNMIVAPAAISYFVIVHDNEAIAGQAETLTITAKDSLGNTKTDYTATVNLDTDTSTPSTITWGEPAPETNNGILTPGAGDTATYAFHADDNGVVTLTITDTQTETINIAVSQGGAVDNNTEGNLVVKPSALDHFIVSHDGVAVTGISENVIVTAYDTENNIKTDYGGTIDIDTDGTPTSIAWTLKSGNGTFNDDGPNFDTADYTFDGGVSGDQGTATFGITNFTAQSVDIDVADGAKVDTDSEGTLQFASSGIDHFLISHDNNAIVSSPESITIYAKNAGGNTITTYQGQITVTTDGTAAGISWVKNTGAGSFLDNGDGSATYTYNPSDNGVVILDITDTYQETIDITVTGEGKTDNDAEGGLLINPTGLHHFTLSHSGTTDTNTPANITVTAHDANNIAVDNYTGQITIDTTNGTASAITWSKITGSGSFTPAGAGAGTATYTYVDSDDGVCVLAITDTKVETVNIRVAGGGKSDSDTEGSLAITPGAIDHFVITHDAQAVAGVHDNITIRAQDAYNNVKTNYQGMITVTANSGYVNGVSWLKVTGLGTFVDGGASNETATYTFVSGDNGQCVLSIASQKAESINISISGDATDDNSEGNLVIIPAAINNFIVAHDNVAEANVAENVTITAYDVYANVKDNYTGTITITTSGTTSAITWANPGGNDGVFTPNGAGQGTATYAYNDLDDGFVTLTVKDTKTESIDVDVSGSAKTDTDSEGLLVVGPTAIGYFVITHDAAAEATVAENITVKAYDTQANLKTNYTGQITLDTDTSDATTITWGEPAPETNDGTFNDNGSTVDTATYTYAVADAGLAIFTITATLTETLDINVTAGAKEDNNTHSGLVIGATNLGDFLISHDNQGVVNSAEPVTITARDTQGNTKTNYTGTVTVSAAGETGELEWALVAGAGSFQDNGAGNDSATYTFNASGSDLGVVELTVTSDSSDTINIAVADGGATDDDSEGTLSFTSSIIVIDNLDSGYSENTVGTSWTTQTTGNEYGANWRRDTTLNDGDWARFTPNIDISGNYEVSAFWSSAGVALATDTPYTVYYSGGNSGALDRNQETNGAQWNVLGTYNFAAGTGGYVEIGDGANDDICADAIKFELKGSADITANSVVTTTVASGQSDILILDVTVSNNAITADTITSVTVNNTGTASDSEITSVKLYYDSDNSGAYSVSDTQTGTGSFASGAKIFSGLNITLPGAGTEDLFIVLETAQAISDGDILDVAIPVNGVQFTNAPAAESSIINSSGTRAVALVLDHYVVSHDGAAVANVPETITATIKDVNNNTITSFGGVIGLDATGGTGDITWAKVGDPTGFTDGGPGDATASFDFQGTENGVASFTITDKKAETVNIAVTGGGKTDENAEGNLVIAPAAIDHFVISHDLAATAGSPETLSVTAKDANENTVYQYTGQITLDPNPLDYSTITWDIDSGLGAFNPTGGGTGKATYTFVAGDNSVASFTLTDSKAESLDIDITGVATDDETEGNLVVSAAGIDHFRITHDGAAQAGVAENMDIEARDAFENPLLNYNAQITVSTNGTGNIAWLKVAGAGTFNDGGPGNDTATYTYHVNDDGKVTLSITDTTIENLNIAVSGSTKFDDDAEGTLNVGPGTIDHFTLSHDGFAQQGQAENITIDAYDSNNNKKTDYTGTVTLSAPGSTGALTWGVFDATNSIVGGNTYTFDVSDGGDVVLTVNDDTAETINIKVEDGSYVDDDNEGVLDVVAAGFHHFKITHDQNAVVNVAETITITAKDSSDVTVTNFSGLITLDTNSATPNTLTWAEPDAGTNDGTFTPGSGDTATYDFDPADEGVAIFTLTDTVTESFNISVSGSGKSDDNTEGNLLVNPVGINHFTITHDNGAVAGQNEDITIVAHDANDTIVTGYTGSIVVTPTGGTTTAISWTSVGNSGTLQNGVPSAGKATYQFAVGDAGDIVLRFNDTKAESVNIDILGDGKTDDDEEGNIAVIPDALEHFVIAFTGGATVGAGANKTLTVTAKDNYENTIPDYAGTITLETSATGGTVTWGQGAGNFGTFTPNSPGAGQATYTFTNNPQSDLGNVTFTVSATKMESIDVTAKIGAIEDDDTEGSLVVGPGALQKFIIVHNDGVASVGDPELLTVTVYDTYNNIKTDYSGTVNLYTNGTGNISWALSAGSGNLIDGGPGVDSATYQFSPGAGGDNGDAVFTITDEKDETLDVDVSAAGKFDDDSEGALDVIHDGIHHFVVAHDGQATANIAENVTVNAKDFYENDVLNFGAIITLSSDATGDIAWTKSGGQTGFTDGGPGNNTATFDFQGNENGTASFTITALKAESIDVTVDDGTNYDNDAEGSLVIGPAALSKFVITHDGEAIQDVAENITVTAYDPHDNKKTNYTGTITLNTSATAAGEIVWALASGVSENFTDNGAANDSATYTFALSDAGDASFTVTDNAADTLDITAFDGGIYDDDTEGNLVIQASTQTVGVVANSITSGYVAQGSSDKLLLSITLTNNYVQSADTIESITITKAGTIADNEIASVKLYYDSNNSDSYSSGVDTEKGTGVFSGGAVTFSNLNINLGAAGTEELYVVVTLAGTVVDGRTMDASVAQNGIQFANAPDAPESAVNSTGLFTVDAGIPTDVGGLSTSSHAAAIAAWSATQSKDNTVQVSWTPATDSGSGVDGYSVLWNTSPATLPDAIKDIEQTVTTVTSSALADGIAHYFHIRSVDNVGNWDTTAQHIGPFYIDTTGPTQLSVYQISEYAGGDYLYVNGSTVYYSGAGFSSFIVYVEGSDALSGLQKAVFPAAISAGGTDSSPAGGVYEFDFQYNISSAGSNYNNINVVVHDIAGNTSNVPFSIVLDNTPPPVVSGLSSSTHTPGVSSGNNDITFIWSDVTDTQTGLNGYSIVVDTAANTVAPKFENVNAGVGTYTQNDLNNGTYYAHIRPVDNVGNWGTTAHAGPYIIGRGSLLAVLASSKSVVSTDQNFTVTMTVNNTGSAQVDSVDPSSLTVAATGGASAGTGSNPAAQNIPNGQNKQYQWTYTAGSSPGTLSFSGNASGTDANGAVASNTAISPDIYVESKASLSVGVAKSASTVNVSQTITLTVTFTNSGAADAVGVVPSLTPSGTANPTIDSGPTPSSATVKGGQQKQFTYTAHGITAGTATFTANISSGTDENSNAILSVTSSQANVTVQAAPNYELTSSLSAIPTALEPAATITVTMNVQNTGNSTIDLVSPSTLTIGGTSSDAILSTGPTPASVASLAAGATQQFSWTYTAGTTLGTVNFTGNASGTQDSSTSTSSGNVTIQAGSAVLTSSIAATPAALLTNSTITVTMTVNNTVASGGSSANNVSPSILTLGGTSGQANLLTGPVPASATIAPQGSKNFVWTYKAGSTPGTVNFTGNATGTDSNSSADVSSTSNSSGDVTVTTLSPAWTYPTGTDTVGPIRSVPIGYNVMTDYIYFGSDDNNLYILDGDTHQLVSSFTASGDIRGLPYPSTEVRGVDFVDIVYFGTLGNTVYALWADNALHWERVLGEALSTAVLYDYVGSVYFGTQAGNVYSLDAADGTDVWTDTTTVGGAIETSPSLIYVPTLSYDEVYFGSDDGKMYGFKAADGTGARTFDTQDGVAGAIKTAPVIVPQGARRLMFFGTENGKFYAVNVANMSNSTVDTGWATNPFVAGGSIVSAPWVSPNYIFFGSQDGKLYALRRDDGTLLPNFPIDVGSAIDSWPIEYNGVVYFGADNGKFYAARISTGEILPGWPYNTGAPIKGGASLHQIFDESYELIDVFILIGSDSGKLYSFEDQ